MPINLADPFNQIGRIQGQIYGDFNVLSRILRTTGRKAVSVHGNESIRPD